VGMGRLRDVTEDWVGMARTSVGMGLQFHPQWRREGGRGRAAAAGGTEGEGHLRGENPECWRLHCNVRVTVS